MTYPKNSSMFKVQGSKLKARDLEPGTWNLEQRARRVRARGFTLVEMIVVIAITGILGAVVAVFIRRPVEGYIDTARRAELSDIAETVTTRCASAADRGGSGAELVRTVVV